MKYQPPYPDEPERVAGTDCNYGKSYSGAVRGVGRGYLYYREYLGRPHAHRYYPFMHGTEMLDAVATVQQFDSSTTGD